MVLCLFFRQCLFLCVCFMFVGFVLKSGCAFASLWFYVCFIPFFLVLKSCCFVFLMFLKEVWLFVLEMVLSCFCLSCLFREFGV